MDTKDLKFTEKHEWARVSRDTATIGISDYAQGQFGDIVYIELPAKGVMTVQGKECANIESVKAVEATYAPVSGEVVDVNKNLEASPEMINKDPYGEGWICKIKMSNPAELNTLMDSDAYEKYMKKIEEK